MFEVKKVYPGVYLILFKDHYQLCMHFVRFQERYESPKFKGQNFELVDLMEWYSKKYGNGLFTYPKDWAGFNLPGSVILGSQILDESRYDRLMKSIAEYCLADNGGDSGFYIIGARSSDKIQVVKHEIAHAFFFVDEKYRDDMTKLVDELPLSFRQKFTEVLASRCYDSSVFVDEIQAYMATGLLSGVEDKSKKLRAPFTKLFNSYFRRIKI